jgi:hypothetical protein
MHRSLALCSLSSTARRPRFLFVILVVIERLALGFGSDECRIGAKNLDDLDHNPDELALRNPTFEQYVQTKWSHDGGKGGVTQQLSYTPCQNDGRQFSPIQHRL